MERHAAIARWLGRCESELERAFSLALLVGDEFSFEPEGADRFVDDHGIVFEQKLRIRPTVGRVIVADFVFQPPRLVVEIDGSVFHDGQVEQRVGSAA